MQQLKKLFVIWSGCKWPASIATSLQDSTWSLSLFFVWVWGRTFIQMEKEFMSLSYYQLYWDNVCKNLPGLFQTSNPIDVQTPFLVPGCWDAHVHFSACQFSFERLSPIYQNPLFGHQAFQPIGDITANWGFTNSARLSLLEIASESKSQFLALLHCTPCLVNQPSQCSAVGCFVLFCWGTVTADHTW